MKTGDVAQGDSTFLLATAISLHELTLLCFLQLISSVCRTPVGEDGAFAKKRVVVQRNRYKDKYPCALIEFNLIELNNSMHECACFLSLTTIFCESVGRICSLQMVGR